MIEARGEEDYNLGESSEGQDDASAEEGLESQEEEAEDPMVGHLIEVFNKVQKVEKFF